MRDQLTVRLPRLLNAAVKREAERVARRPSDIVRMALQDYLQTFPAAYPATSVAREDPDVPAWRAGKGKTDDRAVQLSHVPNTVYQTLKIRAAREGVSLSDYVLEIVRRSTERPTPDEFWERLRTRTRVALSVAPADLIREDRNR